MITGIKRGALQAAKDRLLLGTLDDLGAARQARGRHAVVEERCVIRATRHVDCRRSVRDRLRLEELDEQILDVDRRGDCDERSVATSTDNAHAHALVAVEIFVELRLTESTNMTKLGDANMSMLMLSSS